MSDDTPQSGAPRAPNRGKPKAPDVVRLEVVRSRLASAEAVPLCGIADGSSNALGAASSSLGARSTAAAAEGTSKEAGSGSHPPPGTWGGGDEWDPETGLPKACPVTPLGKHGDTCFYLDADGQLAPLKVKEHGRLPIIGLFGDKNILLREYWPARNAQGHVKGCDFGVASEALLAACSRVGLWKPENRVRGPGAWAEGDGRLVLHLGDLVIRSAADGPAGDEVLKPGLYGGFVYPAFAPLPKPALDCDRGEAGDELLKLFGTWAWKRPEIAPILLLGWNLAAKAGAALKWRPLAWITGAKGTGKSTVQEIVGLVQNDAIVQSSDATGAGIWQKLGYGSLPVAIDEAEPDGRLRRIDGVIKLARQAASGGVVLRGGGDHQGVDFVAKSCFLFSSIMVPPLEGADLSRIAILELDPLAPGADIKIDKARMRRIGAALTRRLIDHWPSFAGRLETYRAHLAENGHDARGQDQYGTLLALADLALYDAPEVSTEHAAEWAHACRAEAMGEWIAHPDPGMDMLAHLATTAVEPYRSGGRKQIADWIWQAHGDANADKVEAAEEALRTYGLMVAREPDGYAYLAIANSHRELAAIFADTEWGAKPGKTGGWRQAALRIRGARPSGRALWFGSNIRAVLVPLAHILPGDAQMPPDAAAAAIEGPEA